MGKEVRDLDPRDEKGALDAIDCLSPSFIACGGLILPGLLYVVGLRRAKIEGQHE